MTLNQILEKAHDDEYVHVIKLRKGRGSAPAGTSVQLRAKVFRESNYLWEDDCWAVIGDMPGDSPPTLTAPP